MSMIKITLQRLETGPDGTFGTLVLPNRLFLFTCEPPVLDKFGCISQGDYQLYRHNGVKYQNTWGLIVPGRTGILFHAGNSSADTRGCILVGLQKRGGQIYNSQDAMTALRGALTGIEKSICSVHDCTSHQP